MVRNRQSVWENDSWQSHSPSVCNQTREMRQRMGERWEWWKMLENAEILIEALPGTTEEELKHPVFSLIEKRKHLSVCVSVCGFMCAPVWKQLCMWKTEKCVRCPSCTVTFNILCVFFVFVCLSFFFFNQHRHACNAMYIIYHSCNL